MFILQLNLQDYVKAQPNPSKLLIEENEEDFLDLFEDDFDDESEGGDDAEPEELKPIFIADGLSRMDVTQAEWVSFSYRYQSHAELTYTDQK